MILPSRPPFIVDFQLAHLMTRGYLIQDKEGRRYTLFYLQPSKWIDVSTSNPRVIASPVVD
jgi:hypothetical protein